MKARPTECIKALQFLALERPVGPAGLQRIQLGAKSDAFLLAFEVEDHVRTILH